MLFSGIIFPLIIPVVVHLTDDTDVYIKTIGAAFSSTVFGNLCSPIADTTIASALFTSESSLDIRYFNQNFRMVEKDQNILK